MSTHNKRQRGVNLIELIVVLSVLTISVVAGIPGFSHFVTRMDRTTAIMDLTSSVQLARSEAARRSLPVTICSSADATQCSASTNHDWSNGWLVFVDAAQDRSFNGDDELLAVVAYNTPRFTMTTDNHLGSGFVIRADGFLTRASVGTMSYCDAFESRDLYLNYTGRLDIDVTESPCP
jgi:type IV fimbrial biogenesis protein FimT